MYISITMLPDDAYRACNRAQARASWVASTDPVRPTSIDFGASTGLERPTSIDLGASTYLKRPTSIDFASSLP